MYPRIVYVMKKIDIKYILSLVGVVLLLCAVGHGADRFEEAPIFYSETNSDNLISVMQEALDSERITLQHEGDFGYLKSVLKELDIPISSQVLVFSKTSFQNRYIAPTTPRAIYFNDEVYVGTVHYGDVLEISVADPNLGAAFYSLSQDKTEKQEFIRQADNCLQCHASTLTQGIPGHVVRSVFPDKEGFPILKAGSHVTTQNSPFEERWGGWYVTGEHGSMRHMGNVLAEATERDAELDSEAGANRMTLDDRVNGERYLTPHSDIVALMVLEHQTQMHNLITQASFETRMALKDQSIMDEILERDSRLLSDSTQWRIANAGEKLLDYMLFVNEEELDDPVKGSSSFTKDFAKRGPFDDKGRSLREFDLEDRTFKYPLSYLIYSAQFDGLPGEMKDYLYRRLHEILSGEDDDDKYLHLNNAKCRAIRQILAQTKSDLPAYWDED